MQINEMRARFHGGDGAEIRLLTVPFSLTLVSFFPLLSPARTHPPHLLSTASVLPATQGQDHQEHGDSEPGAHGRAVEEEVREGEGEEQVNEGGHAKAGG